MLRRLGKWGACLCCAVVGAGLTGCSTTLGGDIASLPNGCVIDAANYQAALRAKHAANNLWSRVLVVERRGHRGQSSGHAYTVFDVNGIMYAYDRRGSWPVKANGRDAMSVAKAIDPWTVRAYYAE